MLEVLEPLAPKFGDTPIIPIGCNRLQSVATDREVWCGNGISEHLTLSSWPWFMSKLQMGTDTIQDSELFQYLASSEILSCQNTYAFYLTLRPTINCEMVQKYRTGLYNVSVDTIKCKSQRITQVSLVCAALLRSSHFMSEPRFTCIQYNPLAFSLLLCSPSPYSLLSGGKLHCP